MGTRSHFLLRAAAIAVLAVEAMYPRATPSTTPAPAAVVAPVVAQAPAAVAAL